MAKLTLLALLVGTVAIGFFQFADSYDESQLLQETQQGKQDLDSELDDSDQDRTAQASASASAQANARGRPGYGPRPGPVPRPDLVQCYVCTDCPKVLLNTTYKWCPQSYDNSKQRSCVVYAEKYKHMKKPWYIRGCASERGSCADIRQAHSSNSEIVKLLSCDECEGDRCNTSGAFRKLSDLTIAFIALIVTPLFAKYTLS